MQSLKWLQTLVHLQSLDKKDLKSMYLAYDNMCNVTRLNVAKHALPLPPPMNEAWLDMNKIIDSFHLPNHVNPECKERYSPKSLKEQYPAANTQAGEQTFVWLGRFKHIICVLSAQDGSPQEHVHYEMLQNWKKTNFTEIIGHSLHCCPVSLN